MSIAVDLEPTEADQRRLTFDAVRPAQQRANPQDQLSHAIRFYDIVVCADLEADDTVDLLALGGAHHHGDIARAITLAQLATDLRTREIWEHQVEHDHVGERVCRRAREALAAAVSDADREALRAQIVLERGGEVDLVLDNQYEHGGALARSS